MWIKKDSKPINIYQFKVTLKEAKPKIWRRIQVPSNYSFMDLHFAIQDSFGWTNSHLHRFEIKNQKTGLEIEIGIPDEEYDDVKVIHEEKAKIAKYFVSEKDKAIYEYDFGDSWMHEVLLEKILPVEANKIYPQCIGGARACPPEDCGGVWGYEKLLAITPAANHEEYQKRIEWLGEEFNPSLFDPASIKFSSPSE